MCCFVGFFFLCMIEYVQRTYRKNQNDYEPKQ